MFNEIATIIGLLAIAAVGWWYYRNKAAAARKSAEAEDPFEQQERARAYEIAKAQADLSRWSGPH